MGSDEDIGSPGKSDKPSSSTTQEQSNNPLNPEWANVQAYYGPGMPMQPPPPYMNCAVMAGHSPYHPHMWAPPPQAMMAHYGMPYSSMYSPHGIVYAHPAVPLQVSVDGQQQTNTNKSSDCADKTPQTTKKRKGSNDKVLVEFDGQGSAHSRREQGIDDASSNDSDNNTPATSSFPEVEENGNNNNNAKVVDGGSPFLVESRQSKRERRKQANRESARRSRLRKQSETEELMETYESLKMENSSLKSEINQLIDQSDKLRLENQALSRREEELFNNNNSQTAGEETETRMPSLLLLSQSDQGNGESKKLNHPKRKKTKAVVVGG